MSEFSSGVVFLNKHLPIVQEAARSIQVPVILRGLNEKWCGFFPSKPDLESCDSPWLMRLSKKVPLLLLEITDDHGWGYDVLDNGQVTAELWVDYELESGLAEGEARERYPEYEDDLMDAIMTRKIPFDEIQRKVAESQEYRDEVNSLYTNANVEALAVFEIAPDAIAELAAGLTPESYLNDARKQVYLFQDKLELREFEWMSYRYLSQESEGLYED